MNFKKTWKNSKKPRNQRKYRFNTPIHIRGRLFNAHLSDELSKKFNKRAIRVKKGDRVKIMKGQFKGKTGKVDDIDTKRFKLYISGIDLQKKDGTKTRLPIPPSNVMITELQLNDKKRQEILKRK